MPFPSFPLGTTPWYVIDLTLQARYEIKKEKYSWLIDQKIEYCNDRYPLDCHFERVHEDKCIKLSHP